MQHEQRGVPAALLKMKRNVKSVFKFLLLSGVTVVFTVLLFRLLKSQDLVGHAKFYQRDRGPLPFPPEEINVSRLFLWYFFFF